MTVAVVTHIRNTPRTVLTLYSRIKWKLFLGQQRRRLRDILVFVFIVVENEAIRCFLELIVQNSNRGLENSLRSQLLPCSHNHCT